MEKEELRKEMIRKLRAFPRKKEESEALCRMIAESTLWKEAETVLAFFPLSTEPDISPLLDDRRVLLPYTENGEMHFSASRKLRRSALGIYEPEHIPAVYSSALMLVPLLGFDGLSRLGRGGGFYDRYIAANKERIITAGIAVSISLLEDFEGEDHDAVLDMVITPDSVVRNPGYASL